MGRMRAVAEDAGGWSDALLQAGRNVGNFASVIAQGMAPDGVAYQRMQICQACQAVDQDNTRIFRAVDGVPVCGDPFLSNPARVPSQDGCGCRLDVKVQFKAAQCPLGFWGAV